MSAVDISAEGWDSRVIAATSSETDTEEQTMYVMRLVGGSHYFHNYADAAYFGRSIGSPVRPALNLSKD